MKRFYLLCVLALLVSILPSRASAQMMDVDNGGYNSSGGYAHVDHSWNYFNAFNCATFCDLEMGVEFCNSGGTPLGHKTYWLATRSSLGPATGDVTWIWFVDPVTYTAADQPAGTFKLNVVFHFHGVGKAGLPQVTIVTDSHHTGSMDFFL